MIALFGFGGMLVLALVILQVVALRKIRLIHLQSFEILDHARATRSEAENLFGQIQCLGLLERTLDMHQKLPLMRGWAGSPDLLLHLARHALSHRPRIAAECSSGVSTLVLARCMQMNGAGHVYSLEHEELYAEKTRAMLREHGLDTWATVVHAPLIAGPEGTPWYDELALPAEMKEIELLVVDGPPQGVGKLARYPALPRLLHRMAPTFTVFADDAARDDEQEMLKRWLREVPRLQLTNLVAEKGLAMVSRSLP